LRNSHDARLAKLVLVKQKDDTHQSCDGKGSPQDEFGTAHCGRLAANGAPPALERKWLAAVRRVGQGVS